MDKKRIELTVTVCLITIFIIAVANGVRATAKKRQISASHTVLPASPKPAGVPADKPQAVGQEQEEEDVVGRDPFKRQAAMERSAAKAAKTKNREAAFLLTGIIYDKDNPDGNYCIVNGEVLKLGESSAGFIVTVISKDYVVLTSEKENKDYKVSLWNE